MYSYIKDLVTYTHIYLHISFQISYTHRHIFLIVFCWSLRLNDLVMYSHIKDLVMYTHIYIHISFQMSYTHRHIFLIFFRSLHLKDLVLSTHICIDMSSKERRGAGVETQKNVQGEIGGWGRVRFNEPYAPSLSTIYDGA